MPIDSRAAMAAFPQTELLAPAGDWAALRAAVAHGADAVYFGLSNFNARHRATNFTLEELPEVIGYLHQNNVRGYVTCNTLIFSEELPQIAEFIAAIAASQADAVIVQDLGLVRLIRGIAPELPVHGSTQMTLTEPVGIEFVRKLGVERVILARELSLDEIVQIRRATDVPVEVFVHGALCVAYSGQCLTSEALGGRSANRGQCAQACRLPYDLVVDGAPRPLGDVAYLLSPQDLAAHDLVDQLVAAGVCSLKIEGRLKNDTYVSVTTKTYRAALDAAFAGGHFTLDEQGAIDLEQSFSRGFAHGFFDGPNHQRLVHGRFSKSRGLRAGVVTRMGEHGVTIALDANRPADFLQPGDGVVIETSGVKPLDAEAREQGGRLFGVVSAPAPDGDDRLWLHLDFARDSFDRSAVRQGAIVWRTDDHGLRRRLEQHTPRRGPYKRRSVSFTVRGAVDGPLELTATSGPVSATVVWPGPLQAARKHPATAESLAAPLGRLGETPFELANIQVELSGEVMIPTSVANDLRRQAIDRLMAGLATQRAVHEPPGVLATLRAEIPAAQPAHGQPPRLHVLARSLEQLAAVLAWRPAAPLTGVASVSCDFEDVRRYRDAVPMARAAGVPIGLATLRVVKPGEEGWLRQIARCGPDAVLVRNLASLEYFRRALPEAELWGDFSLNVANELTAQVLHEAGLARLVPSYDLNFDQLAAMLGRINPRWFEVVVHQHMPMFHMEHCVFAHTLSDGKDWRDCGRPCDHHRVELRDRVGSAFPLLADAGCRNTVFNSVPQSAAEYLPRMLELGVREFRVELLRQSAAEVGPLLERYARVLAGLDDGRGAWRGLQVLNQLGVTRGTLERA